MGLPSLFGGNKEQEQTPQQTEQPQQQQETFMPSINPMQQFPELTKWTLDPYQILMELQHDLRGEIWDIQQSKWVQAGEKLLNDKGINTIIALCKTIINKNAFLSNLNEEEINFIVLDLANDLTISLFVNSDEWELESEKGYQNLIIDKVRVYMYLGLKRAWNQGERNFIKSMEQTVRRIDETRQPKSFFGNILGK